MALSFDFVKYYNYNTGSILHRNKIAACHWSCRLLCGLCFVCFGGILTPRTPGVFYLTCLQQLNLGHNVEMSRWSLEVVHDWGKLHLSLPKVMEVWSDVSQMSISGSGIGTRLLMEEIMHQLIGTRSLSHYLQGFLYVRWCSISAINRSTLNLYHHVPST